MPLAELGTFLYRLKNHCVVILLEVGDAKDAFKLFETINNRGRRLSSPDIIKNLILGNAARFDQKALGSARRQWAALLHALDGVSLESFFRHLLFAQFKRRIRKSEVIGLFKAEVIHRRGPWRSFEAGEYATLEWVDWFNHRRLLEPIGHIPPAEAEARYYAQAEVQALAA